MKEYIIKIDESKHDIMDSVPLMKPPKELVRCKDCRYYKPEYVDEECRLFNDFTTDPDWFCADGERKELEGEA